MPNHAEDRAGHSGTSGSAVPVFRGSAVRGMAGGQMRLASTFGLALDRPWSGNDFGMIFWMIFWMNINTNQHEFSLFWTSFQEADAEEPRGK